MKDIYLFLSFLSIVIIQRLIELYIAKGNERWMKEQGAIEFGSSHYRLIVYLHCFFLFSFCLEKLLLNKGISPIWPFVLAVFLVAQLIRIWVISSLGRFWNTKIIVLKDRQVVTKGPYRYIKHPNYLIVAIELIVIPILFEAYYTSVLFTILNIFVMKVRIPTEEAALKNLTEYEMEFANCRRFFPILLHKSDR